MSKHLSAVGRKRNPQFFDSALEPRSRVICSCRFHVGFSVVVVLYSYIVELPLFKVCREDKPNKKFVVAENFVELVSTVALTCLEGGGFDPL